MGVTYIPVVEKHVCTLPYKHRAFQAGDDAPSKRDQINAGIFYECDGCPSLYFMGWDRDSWANDYEWKEIFPLFTSSNYRKWKRAQKLGILASRDDDEIVKELNGC